MTSTAQIEANRANSQKSTGPRTEAGRAVSAQNATTHGLTSRRALLPGECAEEFKEFYEAIRARYAPDGPLEEMLVGEIASGAWRLRRIPVVEAELFQYLGAEQQAEIARRDIAAAADLPMFTNAGAEARAAEAYAHQTALPLGAPFAVGCRQGNAFGNLSRYEAQIANRMTRAMHELERLQERRRGGDVPVPAVVDVTVAGQERARLEEMLPR